MKNTKHGNMPLGYEVNISAMAVSILFDGLVLDDFFGIPILGHTRMCLVSKVGAIVKSWTVDCIYIINLINCVSVYITYTPFKTWIKIEIVSQCHPGTKHLSMHCKCACMRQSGSAVPR